MSTLNIKTDRQQEIVDITEQITQIVRGSGLVSPVHLAHQRRAHSSGSRAGSHCRHAGRIQPTDSGVRVQPTTIPARPCPHTQRDNRGVSRCADPLRNSGPVRVPKSRVERIRRPESPPPRSVSDACRWLDSGHRARLAQ